MHNKNTLGSTIETTIGFSILTAVLIASLFSGLLLFTPRAQAASLSDFTSPAELIYSHDNDGNRIDGTLDKISFLLMRGARLFVIVEYPEHSMVIHSDKYQIYSERVCIYTIKAVTGTNAKTVGGQELYCTNGYSSSNRTDSKSITWYLSP